MHRSNMVNTMKAYQTTDDGKYRMMGRLLYEYVEGSYFYVFTAPPHIESITAAIAAYEEREYCNFVKRSEWE